MKNTNLIYALLKHVLGGRKWWPEN